MNVSPPQLDVYVAVQAFVMSVTGLGMPLVIQGLPNRSAMPPAAPGFVTMQLERAKRLRTNQVTWDPLAIAPTSLDVEQGTELRLQLDLYGAASGDWGVMLQTLLRDETGCIALAPACQPLYASDAQLAPLEDDELQYEQRWTIEAILQYNPVTSVPMQFADTAVVTVINVDEAYPP
jgi:hypothetical protein